VQKPVVKASREWICIRLLTYESEAEYEFMEELLGVQKGTLPNTVFCMLAPDGKTRLSRPSRSPSFFRTPENLATQMQRLAAGYKSPVPDSFVAPIPLIDRVDLALNVAASDNRPLIVAYHSNTDGLNTILNSVKHVIWEPEFIGQFMIAATTQPEDLKPLSGETGEPGLYVIEPDEYHIFKDFCKDPTVRIPNAFNYIDARDLGQAVELCINKDGLGFEIFNVSNDQNSVDLNTQEIIKNYYPNVPLKYELGSQECLYSNKKIKNMLGFSPVYDWQKQL